MGLFKWIAPAEPKTGVAVVEDATVGCHQTVALDIGHADRLGERSVIDTPDCHTHVVGKARDPIESRLSPEARCRHDRPDGTVPVLDQRL